MVEAASQRAPLFADIFGGSQKDPRGESLRPVVFLHGWLMDRRTWSAVVDAPELADALRVCVDLRGHGRSTGAAPDTLSSQADEVLRLATDMGWSTFDVVGHSMGGGVAQILAARAPHRVRRVALLATVPIGGLPLPPDIYASFDDLAEKRDALEAFLAPQIVDASALAAAVDLAVACPTATAQRSLRAWTQGAERPPDGSLTMPCLIMGGAEDAYISRELLETQVAPIFSDAELRILESCGHYPQLDQPATVARALGDFLGA